MSKTKKQNPEWNSDKSQMGTIELSKAKNKKKGE
jgi:hypothetical protein